MLRADSVLAGLCVGLCVGFLIGVGRGPALETYYERDDDDDPYAASTRPMPRGPTEKRSSFRFDIPSSAEEVVINVGSNLDPIMPTEDMGPCAHSIAVEPVVGCRIPPHRRLSVLHAAVSAEPGVTSMRMYNKDAMSSSLSAPAKEGWWNNKAGRDGGTILVPVVTLSSILSALPDTARVSLLKTDMQGFDFVAIKEAAPVLKERVSHFFSEVWFGDVYSYHAENDFCRDWLPFMNKLGYTFAKMDSTSDGKWSGKWSNGNKARRLCAEQLQRNPERPAVDASAGLVEGDAYWVRNDALAIPFPECPLLADVKTYSEEEYKSCD